MGMGSSFDSYWEENQKGRKRMSKNFWVESKALDESFQGSPGRKKKSNYGVCNQCKHFRMQILEFGGDRALCDSGYYGENVIWSQPNKVDPIVECSMYYPKGQLDLADMSGIATLIDVKPKEKAGFNLGNGELEVVITPPKEKKEEE